MKMGQLEPLFVLALPLCFSSTPRLKMSLFDYYHHPSYLTVSTCQSSIHLRLAYMLYHSPHAKLLFCSVFVSNQAAKKRRSFFLRASVAVGNTGTQFVQSLVSGSTFTICIPLTLSPLHPPTTHIFCCMQHMYMTFVCGKLTSSASNRHLLSLARTVRRHVATPYKK